MPKWLQAVLQLCGLAAKSLSDVKSGKPKKDAIVEGSLQAAPAVAELESEIAAAIKKNHPPAK